jgi:L-asparaginase
MQEKSGAQSLASDPGTTVNTAAGRVVVLGTGGTIAGRAERPGDNVGYVAGQVAVADLLRGLPGLADVPLEVEQVAQINSKDMDWPVWQALLGRLAFHLARPEVGGVVVTHGTDTLEETAFLLQSVLQPAKPVVLTCAMRPATALVPDGPQNLLDAVTVAQTPGACGVVVVCAGQVHTALDVAKVHTYQLDAFDSGDAGPLARVEEGRLRLFRPWPAASEAVPFDAARCASVLQAPQVPRVALLTSHADVDGALVDALLSLGAQLPENAVRGIVVAGTGNGTVHQRLEAALLRAQQQGVRVWRTSRCARGPVLTHPGQALPEARSLSPVKARLALALELLTA